MTNATRRSEFRDHWRLLLASVIGVGTSLTTLVTYSSGVFLPSITKAMGWSDAAFLVSIAIVLFGASALGPVIGTLADRFGPRRIILLSLAAAGCAWMLLALQTGSIAIFYACFAVLTIAGSGTLPVTWTRGLIRAFRKERGMALGIAMVGTGLFGSLIKIGAFAVLSQFGWRAAYAAIGAFTLVVVLPITYFGFHELERADEPADTPQHGLRVGGALRTGRFWILCTSFFLLSLSLAGLSPNLERLLTHWGFGMGAAVGMASMFGIGIIVGRLVTGWLLDKIWAPLVVVIILLPAAIVYALLAFGPYPETGLLIAIGFLGAATGVEYDALAYLVSRYFGLRAYSAIYGCVYIAFAIGAGLGPSLFAGVATRWGYTTLMIGDAVTLTAGAAILLLLGRYPRVEGGAK